MPEEQRQEARRLFGDNFRLPENIADLPPLEMERVIRAEALRLGGKIMSEILSELPETAPPCPDCGLAMRKKDRRSKAIVSLLGEFDYGRDYYVCDNCGRHRIPKDERLGVSGTKFTPGVKRATALIAASDSFVGSAAGLRELCGIEVSAKSCERIAEKAGERIMGVQEEEIRESRKMELPPKPEEAVWRVYIEPDGTGIPIRKAELEGRKGKQADGTAKTREVKVGCIFSQSGLDQEGKAVRDQGSSRYFGRIGELEDFSRLLYSEASKGKVDYAEEVVVIGDGAKWIWNLGEDNFPGAVQIIDMFHAKEHIFEVIKSVIKDPEEQRSKKAELYEILESGDIMKLVKAFRGLGVTTEEQRKKVRIESEYFLKNRERMRYKEFLERGFFVGSGVIEAACKEVIGRRLKRSGMHWSVSGANKMAALRCAVKSGCFDGYFKEAA